MPYLSRLIEGYRRFRADDWEHEREHWSELAEGQSPQVMILSCADSRVEPAQIFDARPGEMFVVRNIAALAPPYETSPGFHGVSAALEFAVTQLEVGEILVMGHGMCGGCSASLTGQIRRPPAWPGSIHRRLGANARSLSRQGSCATYRSGSRGVSRHGAGSGEGQPRQLADVSVDCRARDVR